MSIEVRAVHAGEFRFPAHDQAAAAAHARAVDHDGVHGNDGADAVGPREVGGGATYDLGCYPISFFRALTGAEPLEISVAGRLGAVSQVDEDVHVRMLFPGDVVAVSYFSFQSHWNTYNVVIGEHGLLQLGTLFDRGDQKELILDTDTAGRSVETIFTGSRYALQVEQMNRVIREGHRPAVSLDFSLGNAVMMDSVLARCKDHG